MRNFVVTTEGENRLGLRELCERYVNDQWFAAHASDELAAEALLDQVKRVVRSDWKCSTYDAKCSWLMGKRLKSLTPRDKQLVAYEQTAAAWRGAATTASWRRWPRSSGPAAVGCCPLSESSRQELMKAH